MLALSALLATAFAFLLLMGAASVRAVDNEADALMPIGGLACETIEGVVVSMGSDSICVSENGKTLDLHCDNPSAKCQLEDVSVGDTVSVLYFDEGGSDPRRFCAYNIERRYGEPPRRFER